VRAVRSWTWRRSVTARSVAIGSHRDFIPNNLVGMAQHLPAREVLERGRSRCASRGARLGQGELVTVYSLRTNSDQVEIRTTMTNGGDETLTDLLSV